MIRYRHWLFVRCRLAHVVALYALLLASATYAEAESIKFVQRAVLDAAESMYTETKWQEPLDRMLARAGERCTPNANDLLTVIEEVVPEENIETGISRREAVRAFIASRSGGQVLVVVGTLTVKQLNARGAFRGAPAATQEREIEVEFVCSPR